VVITFVQTGALYLSAAWLSMIGAGLLAEAIVVSERLRQRSLDSQLLRLGMRFAGIAIAIGLLVQGSYELGFPAYSVLAGLGVGGLAVALAAGQPRQPLRLDADHDREAVSRRPRREGSWQRRHGRGCRLSQYASPNIG
jgi:small-conductance mechanosensitive channel